MFLGTQYSETFGFYSLFSSKLCESTLIIGNDGMENKQKQVPVATRSKAWVCGRSPDKTVGSNPSGGMDIFLS
jgi:hypothetical protein